MIHPETAMIRRQVLQREAFKRAALGTSAMTSGTWKRISVDPPKAKALDLISVFLTAEELERCAAWDQMAEVLIAKGVPADRLDGKPNIRTAEKDGGIMLEIL